MSAKIVIVMNIPKDYVIKTITIYQVHLIVWDLCFLVG